MPRNSVANQCRHSTIANECYRLNFKLTRTLANVLDVSDIGLGATTELCPNSNWSVSWKLKKSAHHHLNELSINHGKLIDDKWILIRNECMRTMHSIYIITIVDSVLHVPSAQVAFTNGCQLINLILIEFFDPSLMINCGIHNIRLCWRLSIPVLWHIIWMFACVRCDCPNEFGRWRESD